jgi:uncharacterized protein (TIGR02996 family)
MTQAETFLQAIIASPDDESLRLIYADWLDERGDPRGEFIRVQCQLANVPEGDPRRPELETRGRDLLGTYEEQWAATVRPWVKAWTFHRGFVEDINADLDTALANADKLFGAAPLRRLTSTCSLFKRRVKHEALPPRAPLHRLLAAACPYLVLLSEVCFKVNDIGDRGLAALADSPQPFRLRRLDLSSANVGDDGVRAFASSPSFPQLTFLSLAGNPLRTAAAFSLAGSKHLNLLAELDLSYNMIGDAGVEALACSTGLNNLKVLRLAWIALGTAAARALADSPYLANLVTLDLRWSRIGTKARSFLRERFSDTVLF